MSPDAANLGTNHIRVIPRRGGTAPGGSRSARARCGVVTHPVSGALVAQKTEHLHAKEGVPGANPGGGTNNRPWFRSLLSQVGTYFDCSRRSRKPSTFFRLPPTIGGQVLVGESFTLDERQERVAEQVGVLPVVEPEANLVQVGRKVLGRELVERTHDAAVQEAPDVLDALSGHVAP